MSGSDSWAGAPTLAASGSTTIDNTGFTSEASEPIPSDGPGDGPWQSVWWKWVAPSTDDVFFSTAGSRHAGGTVGMDTVLAVYTGASLAGLTEIVSNDDGPLTGLDNYTSLVTFTPTLGTTYYIQASGFDNTEYGDLHLAWGLLLSDTPSGLSPADGTVYTPGHDLAITFSWTEGSQTDYQVVTAGALTSDTGDVVSATTSLGITVPYADLVPWESGQTLTLSVRAKQTGLPWSEYASVTVTLNPATPLLGRVGDDQEANESGSSTGWGFGVSIPDGGAGIVFAVTDTAVTSVPSGWTLHDSGSYGSLNWYRYLRLTAAASIGSWAVSGSGTLAAALDVWAYTDDLGNPVGSAAPINAGDIAWGTVNGATGDDCDAAPVTLARDGGTLAYFAGVLYPYTDGPPGTAFEGDVLWDPHTGPFANGLDVFWSESPHRGSTTIDGEPHLTISHSSGFVTYVAGATADVVAHPYHSTSVLTGAGGDNVGCQIAVLDWQTPATAGMGFVLGVCTFN